jgi:hypothetical protein
MNRRLTSISIAFFVLLGITAILLVRVRTNYVLGKPGIKLVDEPTYNNETNVISKVSAYLPARAGNYVSERVEPISTVEQNWLPPDTLYGRRIYTAPDGFQAMISIVLMGTDRTSIHKPQYCLLGQGQRIVGSEVVTVPISQPHPYDLQVMKLSTASERTINGETIQRSGVFMYWFVADGELTPHHGERMWLMGKELFTSGLLQRWAYVAYFGLCAPGEEEKLTNRMKELIAASVPEFQVTTGASKELVQGTPEQKLAQN